MVFGHGVLKVASVISRSPHSQQSHVRVLNLNVITDPKCNQVLNVITFGF